MRFLLFIILVASALSCSKIKETKTIKIKINEINSPSSDNSAQPFLFANDNALYMSWMHKVHDSLVSLNYATINDTVWSQPKEIVKGTDWFVNWADFPAIVENKGNLMSHFLQKSANGTYTYNIHIKQFAKDIGNWQEDFLLHKDSTQSEHGFVTMLPYTDDSFFVTWLDGRNTTGGHDHHGAGAMSLRAAQVSADGHITNEAELDVKTCDCCQTSAAITENGPVVVYRDRSDDEVRDISIARLIDGQWTEPKSIFNDNWKIEGCPVNGPKAVSFKNNLAIAWYTAADEIPKVKLLFSNDNGATFKAPVVIDKVQAIGRVDVAFINEDNTLVSWVTSEENETVIKAMKVHRTGEKKHPFVVALFDPSRSSGFPQLEIVKDKAYFAWTDVSGEKSKIKTAYIELDNL